MGKSDEIAIKASNINKTFKLPHEKQNSIKGLFISAFKSKRSYEKQHVLKDISFEIKAGEFFGIVGRNGSGKSTLLKLLAGIYTPDSGHIQVNGKLTPFIELGVGFNPELTGRENVFLNGALLGFNRKEMEAMYDEIVEFAELERFMDQKLKNYSSGMQVRLAFSIAIQSESEILLLDEVLAVGDSNFQRKCYNFFSNAKAEKRTIILVTHDMDMIRQYCDQALFLEKGKIVSIGDPNVVANDYTQQNLNQTRKELENSPDIAKHWGTGDARILDIRAIGSKKNGAIFKSNNKDISIKFTAEALTDLRSPTFGLVVEDAERRPIFATNTPSMGVMMRDVKKGEIISATFNIENILTDGQYWLSGAISNSVDSLPRVAYDRVEKISSFLVSGRKMKASLTHPKHSIKLD